MNGSQGSGPPKSNDGSKSRPVLVESLPSSLSPLELSLALELSLLE